jgi:hypothetical protein
VTQPGTTREQKAEGALFRILMSHDCIELGLKEDESGHSRRCLAQFEVAEG